MSEISVIRIRISENGMPRDDWEMDVDKTKVRGLVNALGNSLIPFHTEEEEEE